MKFLSSLLLIITLNIIVQANVKEAHNALANKNYEKAYSLFSIYANDGDKEAQLRLGLLYYYGNGVKKDKNKSFFWWTQALLQGSSSALRVLEKYFPKKYSMYYEVPKNARVQMLDGKYKLKSEEYITWNHKNNTYLNNDNWTYFNSKLWFTPKKKLNHPSAINYCKKLKINGLDGFELADFNTLQNYHYNVKKVSFYWSSSQMSDWGKTYINQYGNALSSYTKDKRSFLCVRNAGYKDSAEALAVLLYNEYVKKLNILNIIPTKPLPKDAPKLLKGEFETTQEFNDRKNKTNEKIKEKNKQAIAIWKKYIKSQKKQHMKKLSKFKASKQEVYLKFLQQAVQIKYGDPKISSPKYDADSQVFDIKITSSGGYDQEVKVPVKIKYAKEFKKIIKDKNFKPTIQLKVLNNKLVFSMIKEMQNPENLVEESEYNKAYGIKNKKQSVSELENFIVKYPNSSFKNSAITRISNLKEQISLKEEKERIDKQKRQKAEKLREQKRQKAKKRKQDSYYAKKDVGDKVCKDGVTAIILSITITAYVERVNGNNIQLRIADTEGTTPYFNGVTLYNNTLIWDNYTNWYKCNY